MAPAVNLRHPLGISHSRMLEGVVTTLADAQVRNVKVMAKIARACEGCGAANPEFKDACPKCGATARFEDLGIVADSDKDNVTVGSGLRGLVNQFKQDFKVEMEKRR